MSHDDLEAMPPPPVSASPSCPPCASPGLSLSPGDCEYELRGVLVHMGNANSGHYYSLIKPRAEDGVANPRWLQVLVGGCGAGGSCFRSLPCIAMCFRCPTPHPKYHDQITLSFSYLHFYANVPPPSPSSMMST
jgi:hypothetical protein